KRNNAVSACYACRRRKSKVSAQNNLLTGRIDILLCDGQRPICTRCSQKSTRCVYEFRPNESPLQAMKQALKQGKRELMHLHQFFLFPGSCTEQKALEMLRRIR
ncbi:hypothetical protein BS50DRAFT_473318, partial [Corynespora cassiicola Philippines]